MDGFPPKDLPERPFWPTLVRAYVETHRNWPWVLLYWLAVAGAAGLAGMPLTQSLDAYFRHRPAAAELYPGPRLLYLREWLHQPGFSATWSTFTSLTLGVGLLLWLVHLLVSSGWLVMVGVRGLRRHPVGTGILLGTRTFGRQIQAWPLWFLGWVGVAALGFIAWRGLFSVLVRTHRDGWVVPTFYGGLVVAGLGLGIAGFHWDLTRVLALQTVRKPGLSAWRAVRTALRQWATGLGLVLVYALIPLGAVAVLAFVHKLWMAFHPKTAVALGWLTYALGLWVRLWSRLAYYAHLSLAFGDPAALVEALRPVPTEAAPPATQIGVTSNG
jgi:hypothetical protein